MATLKQLLLSGLGVIAGGLIAIQTVLNSSMGERLGNFGAVFVLSFVSAITLVLLLIFTPANFSLSDIPGFSEWYLYIGGVLGIVIVAAPIFLVPRIGTTSTLIAVVLGQLVLALIVDHFGLFASPKIEINLARGIGVLLVVIGAYLVGK